MRIHGIFPTYRRQYITRIGRIDRNILIDRRIKFTRLEIIGSLIYLFLFLSVYLRILPYTLLLVPLLGITLEHHLITRLRLKGTSITLIVSIITGRVAHLLRRTILHIIYHLLTKFKLVNTLTVGTGLTLIGALVLDLILSSVLIHQADRLTHDIIRHEFRF